VTNHPLSRLHIGARTDGTAGCCVAEVVWRDGGEGVVGLLTLLDRGVEHSRSPVRITQHPATHVSADLIVAALADYQRREFVGQCFDAGDTVVLKVTKP
jgi:hypothetical protein